MLTCLLAAAVIGSYSGPASIYDFQMKTIDGKSKPLSKFKGKVLLVVNVASQCGNTPQYEGLEALYKKYKKKGLVVLGFPANQFGQQEPGTDSEIKKFCIEKYKVSFPMFSKIIVKGENIHPLYAWLIERSGRKDDIEWNFAKFVVERDGKTVHRFSPKTKPDDEKLLAAIHAAL